MFIHIQAAPSNSFKYVTYGKIVCDYRENRYELNRTLLTVGGDRIKYLGDCDTPTSDLLITKLLFNGVLSTIKAEFTTLDIKNV